MNCSIMQRNSSRSSLKGCKSLMIYFGAAYYPEHQLAEVSHTDIDLMKKAGMNVVRMAEFAWSTLQPEVDKFDFDWLDQAIKHLLEREIVTILGTPTAAPPAWLIDKHKEILAVDEFGRPVQFGMRCHYCVNSPAFHQAVTKVVKAMASHFGSNPGVIGWQIDNEYNRVCYCEKCRRAFQDFLKEKYRTLDDLNRRWSTAYWSQTYSEWSQIPLPIGGHNPGLRFEHKRFVTASYRNFQKMQVDALREFLPSQIPITHNFMGWYSGYDHYELNRDLDISSWDYYIPSGHHDPIRSGATHDLTRGFKRQGYWLMETQPGSVNWSEINSVPNKGELRAVAWQAIAHGARAILYWQWRSARGGQEQYHGTLVDQSGMPRPFYTEAARFGTEINRLGTLLDGVESPAEVAILNDYDSLWSIDFQRHHKDFNPVDHLLHYYQPFARRNIPVDIISADESLDGYRLVLAPSLVILKENQVNELSKFVERGGHLVLTIRTGLKDPFNALLDERQPGPLRKMAGIEVEEYYALQESVPICADGFTGSSQQWAELLKPLDEPIGILARYGTCNGWLDGQPAITRHSFGKGATYFIGAYLDYASQQVLMDQVAADAGVNPGLPSPDGVEIRELINREKKELVIVINHTQETKQIRLPQICYDHLHQIPREQEVILPAYEVMVLSFSPVR
jgi:beta-galactosidase